MAVSPSSQERRGIDRLDVTTIINSAAKLVLHRHLFIECQNGVSKRRTWP